jgi:predicted GTPase
MSEQDERLAISVKNQCTENEMVDNLVIYKLTLKVTSTYSGASPIVRRFSYGEPNQQKGISKKTILVMGATGSGKTTWINAMINYVLRIEFEDDFRFKLVDEQVMGASQAQSQTQKVTAYDIHHQNGFRIPYSLIIVDTPGFGDTQGMKRDQKITSAVQQFFEHENGIQVY